MARLSLSIVFLTALVACGGPENSLDGSIGESYDLSFDRVEIRKQGEDLIIEYIKKREVAGGDDKNCKIVVQTENLPLGDDTSIQGDTFLERVTISRVSRTGGEFPEASSGKIEFKVFDFDDNGRIDGEFEAVLDGRTLYGNFDAEVEEVPLDI